MNAWLVRGGKQGEHEEVCIENGLVGIAFRPVPDLTAYKVKGEIFKAVRLAFSDGPHNRWNNFTGQLFSFANRMEVGDVVVMPLRRQPQVAIGRITGTYQYRTDLPGISHVRKVAWLRVDISRTRFSPDLITALNLPLTVCQVHRENAAQRLLEIAEGPIASGPLAPTQVPNEDANEDVEQATDLEALAQDQIRAFVEQRFKSHDLAWLVDSVLRAEGYVTHLSPPGPDGGVDILARRGSLGLEGPRLCVQVKSSLGPADVTILRNLQGVMSTFKADEGLLVCWGGFNGPVLKESRLSFFSVRLWDSDDLLEAVMRNYERIPEELQKELPLKRIWTLVPELRED